MSSASYIAAAVAIGVCVSLQPPINAAMARTLESPLLAASVSIAISLLLVLLLWGAWGRAGGDPTAVAALPGWVVLGGVIGVIFVAGSIVVAPVLGVALFFVCVVAGQLLGSIAADQLGAFGMPVRPVDATKVVGLALVLAGAALVQSANP